MTPTAATLDRLAAYAVARGYGTDAADAAPWVVGYLAARGRKAATEARRLAALETAFDEAAYEAAHAEEAFEAAQAAYEAASQVFSAAARDLTAARAAFDAAVDAALDAEARYYAATGGAA